MTLFGLWILSVVLVAHDTVTRGVLRQMGETLRIQRPHPSASKRYTPPGRARR